MIKEDPINVQSASTEVNVMGDSASGSIEQLFTKALNRHGYGFQFAVIKELYQLNHDKDSNFIFQTVEFPVEVQGEGTRIDIILKRRGDEDLPFFLLAECKRANPALSNWCFVKAPYTNRKFWGPSEPVYIENVRIDGSNSAAFAKPRTHVEAIYHIGLEIRANQKGDSQGDSGPAIENASSQVLRGLNGFVETLFKNPQLLGAHRGANLLPVIFTTANLWASNVDLTNAELNSGAIDLDQAKLNKMPFVFYQYNLSPGIKHGYSRQIRPSDISNLIATEFVRTIPIVSSYGIGEFMKWASYNLDFDD